MCSWPAIPSNRSGQKLVQGNNVYISVHPDSKDEADQDLQGPLRRRRD